MHFSERDYANFSREFERPSTEEILKHDPADTVVLGNDVSEGPDFLGWRARGIACSRFITWMWWRTSPMIYFPRVDAAGDHGEIGTGGCRRILAAGYRAGSIWEKQEASVRAFARV